MMGLLLDFWEMDRKSFLQNADTAEVLAPTPSAGQANARGPSAQTSLPGLEVKKKA